MRWTQMKLKTILLAPLVFILFCSSIAPQTQNLTIDRGAMGLVQALDRLPLISRVMFIAAHPDDENSGVLPFVSRGLHAKSALLTLNRGEGGQNLIGPDLFDGLGLIRTGELLAAGEYYGVQQYFTRAFDFGFSKKPEESFHLWGREIILADMVRAIRHFRPHVIISVWQGNPADGHGQHQACGLMAREAFHAAADPQKFPELLQEGIAPWRVRKFYVRSLERNEKKEKEKETASFKVDPGEYVPLLGTSYQEIAAQGYSFHRSQGNGNSYASPGKYLSSFQLLFPNDPTDSSFLDKLEIKLSELPALLQDEDPQKKWLKQETAALEALALKAGERFQPADFTGVVDPLLKGAAKLQEVRRDVAAKISSSGRADLLFFLDEKEQDFLKALELSTGMYLEALADDSQVTAGQRFKVSATVVNRSAELVNVRQLEIKGGKGWDIQRLEGSPKTLAPQEKMSFKFEVMVPSNAPVTQPHWKRDSKQDSVYKISEKSLTNTPTFSAILKVSLEYALRDQSLKMERPVQYLDSDRLKGSRKVPLLVVPPLALEVTPSLHLVSLSNPGQPRTVQVRLVNNTPGQISGDVALNSSAGWTVEPKQRSFSIKSKGEAATFKFQVVAGEGIQPGRGSFEAVAQLGSRKINQSYRVFSVQDLWYFPLYAQAASEVVAFDFRLPANLSVGYIMGAGDRIAETLIQLGIPVKLLETEDLSGRDLSHYDCIIAGVRAYEVRPDLIANNSRLLDYVKNGGLFIVQYHRQASWNKTQFAPYLAKIKSEDHRVTDEMAPVKILDPLHPVFQYPNKISEKDFDGWVQERGLYFIQERDPRYKPLLSSNDPGEPPLDGGLLVADYGKGKYVLTSYAWFRQLPQGVPGAIRIFTNLISLRESTNRHGK